MKSQPDKISLKKIHAKNTSIEKKWIIWKDFMLFYSVSSFFIASTVSAIMSAYCFVKEILDCTWRRSKATAYQSNFWNVLCLLVMFSCMFTSLSREESAMLIICWTISFYSLISLRAVQIDKSAVWTRNHAILVAVMAAPLINSALLLTVRNSNK